MDINKGVVLYGAGFNCRNVIKKIKETNIDILAVVDADKIKHGNTFEGFVVKPVEQVIANCSANIVITLLNCELFFDIKKTLCEKYQVSGDMIYSYSELYIEIIYRDEAIREILKGTSNIHNQSNCVFFDCLNGMVMGGVESWTKELVTKLKERKYENTYIISNKNVEMFDVSQGLMETIKNIDIYNKDPFDIKTIMNIIEVLKEHLPCIVVIAIPDALLMASYILKRKYGDLVRCISVIHSSTNELFFFQKTFKKYIDLYVATTLQMKERMIESGIEEVEYVAIPFKCDEEICREYTIDTYKPIRVAYAGRLDGFERSQKRLDIMLKLILQLKMDGVDFIFEIVGDGPGRSELEFFVEQNNLNNMVEIIGPKHRSEMADFWKRQDICISTSDWEGRNISVLEAMGQGVVPVVTRTASRGEDIKDGYSGFLFSCGDYITASKIISYLYHNRHVIREIGYRAHEDIFPKSSTETHVKQWVNILKRIGLKQRDEMPR